MNLTTGTLPNMSDVLQGYFQPITFTNVTKSVEGFQVVESPSDTSFRGVIQPFTPQQLSMKPIGQREWIWWMLHAEIAAILQPDDTATYAGNIYRVMEKLDYSAYGYLEYHLVQGYEGDPS